MNFEQPANKDFLEKILSEIDSHEYMEYRDEKEINPTYTPDFKTEEQSYERLKTFLNKVAEQEDVTDKETLIVALKKHSEETTDETEKSMATMLLEEYL